MDSNTENEDNVDVTVPEKNFLNIMINMIWPSE